MKRWLKWVIIGSLLISLVGCSKNETVTSEGVLSETELAVVYIDTINHSAIDKLEKVEKQAEFKIVYTDGTSLEVSKGEDDTYPMTIKGRGNSSWEMPTDKKPYTIKFSEKQDLFGFGEAKKWCLIAGWTDTSFVRNYIGYKLAKTLDETAPDCEMVELFINDHYEGIYLLCEAYGINKNRVETLGDGSDVNGDGEITEYLIEADVRAVQNNEPNKFMTDSGYWMVIKEPDEDIITSPLDKRYTYISEYFNQVDNAITNLDHYEDYIDVDSLIDMYLINEYIKNPDWGFGNQPYYASTFMYMEEGGKLCFGPIWDCDLSFGRNDYRNIELEGYRDTYSPEGYLCKNTHWVTQLMQDPTFEAKVKERWQEFKPYIEEMIETIAPQIIEKVAISEPYDYETFGEDYTMRTTEWSYREPLSCQEEGEYVLDFMKTRLAWMDEEFGN